MSTALTSGSVVAGFRISRLIGKGAAGAVYLAEGADGRQVALKVPIPELAHDERFRQRFLREAQIAAALDEPQVVPTVAFGEADGMLYLAMVDVLDSPGSVVARNRLERNSWNGLVLIGSKGSRVTHNRLDGNKNNGTEVNGASDSVVVAANRANGNAHTGIVVGSAHRVRVVRNRASKNETGFLFFDLHDSLIGANRAGGNHDGLVLSGGQFGSDGNRLVGNVANRNRGSGIALVEDNQGDLAGNSLKGNTANRNADHGMDVVAGTIDKGGNRASGNARPPQCVNVVCSR